MRTARTPLTPMMLLRRLAIGALLVYAAYHVFQLAVAARMLSVTLACFEEADKIPEQHRANSGMRMPWA